MSDAPPPPPDGSNPYGEPPAAYGAGQFGQSAQDPYLPDYGQQPAGDKRPGTVTAAAVVTLVLAGLSAAFMLVATIGLVVAKSDFLREVQKGLDKQDPNTTLDATTLYGAFIVVLVVLVLWSLAACLLAVFVLRRSNVARIVLIISASITALLSLVGIQSGVSIVTLLGSVVVIVLLVTGAARAWFKRQDGLGSPQQPGQTIF